MQLQQLIAFLVTAEMASAVDMTNYDPQPGVPGEFRAFLEAYARDLFDNRLEPFELTCKFQARGSGGQCHRYSVFHGLLHCRWQADHPDHRLRRSRGNSQVQAKIPAARWSHDTHRMYFFRRRASALSALTYDDTALPEHHFRGQ